MSSNAEVPFVSFRVRLDDPALAERLAAEVWEAGACGLEERDEEGRVLLIVYAPARRAAAVERAARETAPVPREVLGPEPVPVRDWPETWKQGLQPVVVSPRLVVRPPFATLPPVPGRHELVIEPRQAFGTGAHASTLLALELLDGWLAGRPDTPAVLDVGCGSGVLALAALRLGARRAVACDLDPIAARETRENAQRASLAAQLAVFVGSVGAIGAPRFDLVVANLIRRELLPILDELVSHTTPGGALLLSGLLSDEQPTVLRELGRLGLGVSTRRKRNDITGDRWLGLITSPRSGGASRPEGDAGSPPGAPRGSSRSSA